MMAEKVKVKWTVTIIEGKLCIFEEDVTVTASVHDDGEVIISNVEITGRVPRHNPYSTFLTDTVTVPMTDSSNPHMVRLGNWAMEILQADDEFIAKAHEAAGLVYVGQGSNDPDGRMEWRAA